MRWGTGTGAGVDAHTTAGLETGATQKRWGTEALVGNGLEQGLKGGAGSGVRGAELPGTGSRCAVFLIHSEVSGGAGRIRGRDFRRALRQKPDAITRRV